MVDWAEWLRMLLAVSDGDPPENLCLNGHRVTRVLEWRIEVAADPESDTPLYPVVSGAIEVDGELRIEFSATETTPGDWAVNGEPLCDGWTWSEAIEELCSEEDREEGLCDPDLVCDLYVERYIRVKPI